MFTKGAPTRPCITCLLKVFIIATKYIENKEETNVAVRVGLNIAKDVKIANCKNMLIWPKLKLWSQ